MTDFSLQTPTLAVFSHPNHELAVFGLLQQLRPWLLFLTDGGGESRVAQTREGLARIGLLERARFLDYPEQAFYDALLAGDRVFFRKLADQVQATIAELAPAQVLCDAVEFYNPVHDVTLPVVRAALHGQATVSVYEIPLIYQQPDAVETYAVQRLPLALADYGIAISLSADQLAAKALAREQVYHSLRAQLGSVLMTLTAEHLQHEYVFPASATPPVPDSHRTLRYEWRARRLLEQGQIKAMITYQNHYLPTMMGLS